MRVHHTSIRAFRRPAFWGGAIIFCFALVAFFPALRGGFIWDDDALLTQNRLIKASDGLFRLWSTTRAPDYWPVTSTTLWIEWRLWGAHPFGYHATNLALHIGESLLLWSVLRRLHAPGAFPAALVFAVHPVNVESVAWISQRKNLMAMLFFLASIQCFLKSGWAATVRRSLGEGGKLWYSLSLLAFILAMLSKSSVAALPLVLLGILAWRRRIFREDLVRIAPFIIAAAALAVVEEIFQRHDLTAVIRTATFAERLLGAAVAVWFYLAKAAWPANLVFVYPRWSIATRNPADWLPLLAAVGATAALWRYRRSGSRPVLFAWAYFCLTLAPALGFIDVHFMRYSLVADHYQHLALIAVAGVTAAGWDRWRRAGGSGVGFGLNLPVAAAVAAVCTLVVLTRRQCETYRDSETLYRTTLDRNPDSWLAHNNLGDILHLAGRIPEAADQFEAALRINPDYPEAHNNLGNILRQTGHIPEAVEQFETALRLDPNSAETHNNLGNILLQQHRAAEAIGEYEKALSIDPAYAEAHNGLGNALLRSGRPTEAIGQYEAAVRMQPDYANAHFDLGAALLESGRPAEAAAQFEAVLRINPGDAEAGRRLRQAEFDLQLNPPDRRRP